MIRDGSASLAGRFVTLEPLTLDHLPALCAVGLDPELWRWTASRVRSADEMRAWVTHALAEHALGRALPYATIERAGGTVVGSTRLANIEPAHRRAEIGWTWVAAPWQRTPVNTEAKLLLMTHAFETLGCVRVELKTDALNTRSRAAIARLGATEEGTLRRHMSTESGRVRDTVYFSVIAEEWPDVKARLQSRIEAG